MNDLDKRLIKSIDAVLSQVGLSNSLLDDIGELSKDEENAEIRNLIERLREISGDSVKLLKGIVEAIGVDESEDEGIDLNLG